MESLKSISIATVHLHFYLRTKPQKYSLTLFCSHYCACYLPKNKFNRKVQLRTKHSNLKISLQQLSLF